LLTDILVSGYLNAMFKAIISSDWNGCLAPSGPFDVISHFHPHLDTELTRIFKTYTDNSLTLGEAFNAIERLLPEKITEEQMDAFLDQSFSTFPGVPELIEWCRGHEILFMVNTTGFQGYFQRIFSKKLLPQVPVVSAHPLIRYPEVRSSPFIFYDLFETFDKGKNTQAAMGRFDIPPKKIILLGDSGGDGPHFQWGVGQGALLIGSMTKPSLQSFCQKEKIAIDHHIPPLDNRNDPIAINGKPDFSFMDLADMIDAFVAAGSRMRSPG
jgi:2-hydroxy-3-keto-5-methylthiopentenyl-1-phosphate phosphatase